MPDSNTQTDARYPRQFDDCHLKREPTPVTSILPVLRHSHVARTCNLCQEPFCAKCLAKFRLPGSRSAPGICRACFASYLIAWLFPTRSPADYYSDLEDYLQQFILPYGVGEDRALPTMDGYDAWLDEKQRRQKGDCGFMVTHEEKPKVPMSTQLADKAARGLLKLSGMYDGGHFTRRYLDRLNQHQVKLTDRVHERRHHTIQVPYRYPVQTEEATRWKIDPEKVFPPEDPDAPPHFDLTMYSYHHHRPTVNDRPRPVVLYFHGGGFVMGDIEDPTMHRTMGRLCHLTEAVIVSVNYRLAPEYKWPTQVEDAYAALLWVHEHGPKELGIDPRMITVAGDSAGGNIALVVAIMAKERRGPQIIHQVAIYPGVDTEDLESLSYYNYGNGPFLSIKLLMWFKEQYFHDPSMNVGHHPYLSPMRYPDVRGLPPLTLLTAGYCPMTDHSRRFAERFRDAGVPYSYTEYSNVHHGFFHAFSVESLQAITQVGVLINIHVDAVSRLCYHESREDVTDRRGQAQHAVRHENEDSSDDESDYSEEVDESGKPPNIFF